MTTYVPGMSNGAKGFKCTPYISIGDWPMNNTYKYFEGAFKKVAFKKVYEEDKYSTLDFVMRRFPAELTMQYMREHGLGVMSNES